MSNKIRVGRTEILGPTFVGKDEIEAAREGGASERAALARRLTTSGYNGHWRYLMRGEETRSKYAQMVAAARKSGRVTEAQLDAITRELLATVDPAGTSPHRDTLAKILRENLAQGGVKIPKA